MCVIPSKESLNKLADGLLKLGEDERTDEDTYKQLNHYRSLFHPLMTLVNTQCRARITRTLSKTKAQKSIVVQRIKRLESIVLKLQKYPKMELSRMQDIGGVRVILPDMDALNIFTENLFHRSKVMKVKEKNTKNYIVHPKDDGYRGVHYLLELENKRLDIAPFKNLIVELQVRTMLQHCWATGVEIAGIINNKHYKTGDWDTDWGSFFLLLSQYFAATENQSDLSIKEYPLLELKGLIDRLNVIERLRSVSIGFKALELQLNRLPKEGFLLLITDFELHEIKISIEDNEELALSRLKILENRFSLKKFGKLTGQVLLVKATDIKNLKKAYPNYYMDTQMLIDELQKLIKLFK
jgi:ppGpp synthetase/RelA/SpoT-type nucleotidyltranferase